MELFNLRNLPPDGDGLAMLLWRLERAHREAGRPAYRQMSRACDLSASTICRTFRATKPPPWENLTRVLKALGIDADVDRSWRELWLNAENSTRPIPAELGDGLVAPGRRNCPSCGAWIADQNRHAAHHNRIERLADSVAQLEWQIATRPLHVRHVPVESTGSHPHPAASSAGGAAAGRVSFLPSRTKVSP